MKELEKLKYEIDLVSKGEHNQEFTGVYHRLTELQQALQLQQTGVIVQSEQLKTCEHNFADIYDHTGTQIVGKKCLNGCGF